MRKWLGIGTHFLHACVVASTGFTGYFPSAQAGDERLLALSSKCDRTLTAQREGSQEPRPYAETSHPERPYRHYFNASELYAQQASTWEAFKERIEKAWRNTQLPVWSNPKATKGMWAILKIKWLQKNRPLDPQFALKVIREIQRIQSVPTMHYTYRSELLTMLKETLEDLIFDLAIPLEQVEAVYTYFSSLYAPFSQFPLRLGFDTQRYARDHSSELKMRVKTYLARHPELETLPTRVYFEDVGLKDMVHIMELYFLNDQADPLWPFTPKFFVNQDFQTGKNLFINCLVHSRPQSYHPDLYREQLAQFPQILRHFFISDQELHSIVIGTQNEYIIKYLLSSSELTEDQRLSLFGVFLQNAPVSEPRLRIYLSPLLEAMNITDPEKLRTLAHVFIQRSPSQIPYHENWAALTGLLVKYFGYSKEEALHVIQQQMQPNEATMTDTFQKANGWLEESNEKHRRIYENQFWQGQYIADSLREWFFNHILRR